MGCEFPARDSKRVVANRVPKLPKPPRTDKIKARTFPYEGAHLHFLQRLVVSGGKSIGKTHVPRRQIALTATLPDRNRGNKKPAAGCGGLGLRRRQRTSDCAGTARTRQARQPTRLLLPRTLLVAIRLQALPALVLVHLQAAFLLEVAHGWKLANGHRAGELSGCPARISGPRPSTGRGSVRRFCVNTSSASTFANDNPVSAATTARYMPSCSP